MIVVKNLNDIDENQQIMRVIDKNALIHSIGERSAEELVISFPLNLLSHYKSCEDIRRQDKKEAQTSVNVGGVTCTVHSCTPAMISCWSLINNDVNPHLSLMRSKFAVSNADTFIIVSTIAKVKKMFQELVDIIQTIRFDYSSQQGRLISSNGLIGNAICGAVSYYPAEGVDISDWQRKTDSKHGVDMVAIQGIFHKERSYYSDENEYRFAILLNHFRAVSQSRLCSMSTMSFAQNLKYPKMIMSTLEHYIDKIYCLSGTAPNTVVYLARHLNIDIVSSAQAECLSQT